ncbi:hypothetical protein THASP1DRAFT_3106, partial [Thamnocephalis sphaerospora]
MSFGRPPTSNPFKPTPPDRGSFPLDHYGSECKNVMQQYMLCLRENRQSIEPCRHLSKAYLQCRMDHELMDKDEMRNLGFEVDDEK